MRNHASAYTRPHAKHRTVGFACINVTVPVARTIDSSHSSAEPVGDVDALNRRRRPGGRLGRANEGLEFFHPAGRVHPHAQVDARGRGARRQPRTSIVVVVRDALVGRVLGCGAIPRAAGAVLGDGRARAWDDSFRASLNDPLSLKGEPRYNMDLFCFFPRSWRGATLSSSVWASAASHCVRQSRNRPEAVLHVVQQEHKLAVRKIGNGSRGTMYDAAKFTRAVPDAFVWHVHKMPNVLRYVQGQAGAPRSTGCAAA